MARSAGGDLASRVGVSRDEDRCGASINELAALGAARISTGSALYREALHAALTLAATISGLPAPEALNYALIQSLTDGENMAE